METNERLTKIETRLDSIDENLERHMKRSDALEAQVQPMTELLIEMRGVVKLTKFLALLAGIVEAVRLFWY